jgi:hypothetical protein
MTSVQTTYPFDRAIGFPGGLADAGPHRIKTTLATLALLAGALVARTPGTPVKGQPLTAPAAADPDGIVTALATAATATTLAGSGLDGAVGAGEMFPPRNITITASSHANFDLTTWYVRGLDENGLPQEEAFVMPDAGNVTLTGKKFFSFVTEVYIPAQAGTAGSLTVGFGSALGPLTREHVHGIAMYDASREPEAYPVGYAVPVVKRGPVYVTSETAYTDGDPVYVRLVAGVGETLGAFRATPDSTDCALLQGARFRRTGSAGVAAIDLS